ncbi:MAG: hypothetical protein AB7O91_11535 [Sphingomonas sp.]
MTSVFDRMAAARAKAVVMRQDPIGWRVNHAAMTTLRDEGAFEDEEGRLKDQLSLFGLPITVDRDDQSDVPLFRLIADEADGSDRSLN